MPFYRRACQPGGTFFFTLVTERRLPIFCDDLARRLLHHALTDSAKRRFFALDAMVLLPDHLHLLIRLPDGDADFSTRIAAVKAAFTHAYLSAGGKERPRSASRARKRRRGVWQRWFWEHTIRDDDDYGRHLDYIHYNPVKHGFAFCPHAWPYSTFNRWVKKNVYDVRWQCTCAQRQPIPPEFDALPLDRME